jgi:hypothetical protein
MATLLDGLAILLQQALASGAQPINDGHPLAVPLSSSLLAILESGLTTAFFGPRTVVGYFADALPSSHTVISTVNNKQQVRRIWSCLRCSDRLIEDR